MEEIIAEVGPEHSVALIQHHSGKRNLIGHMVPQDASYLARGILACADALCGVNPPQVGTIIADGNLAVVKVAATRSGDETLLTFTIETGIDLTFRITQQTMRKISAISCANFT
jgi:hypothetical protein